MFLTVMGIPNFGKYMTRDRWVLIKSNVAFSVGEQLFPPNDPRHDRMFKVRALLTQFEASANRLMIPGKRITLDEAMVLCKGKQVSSETCVECDLTSPALPLPLQVELHYVYAYHPSQLKRG